jgi:uncharacterized protein YlaN (UPF0358 family)
MVVVVVVVVVAAAAEVQLVLVDDEDGKQNLQNVVELSSLHSLNTFLIPIIL